MSKNPHSLNGSQVVGEEVGVADDCVGTLLPAPLEGLAEDKKARREDKKAACDGEAEDGVTARRGTHAQLQSIHGEGKKGGGKG